MKILLSLATIPLLAACGTSYTYEAEPIGGEGKDPREIQCFHIEADASHGDSGDIQLGEFCNGSWSRTGEDND